MESESLTREQWSTVAALFDRLAALPPERRDLDSISQPSAVRSLLESMLAAHDSAEPQLLDHTVRAVVGNLFLHGAGNDQPTDYRNRPFGPWRAREEIGRGGMAVVLKGERADGQFEKEVAIKLLPQRGGEGQQRLIEEIRILARLEHPGIARLIDGGIDSDGSPYLVMEYVRGTTLTEYCRQHGLGLDARIELFCDVVSAVAHAHRHLIVHCDIKPGNILVGEEGEVRLVDFGIANLISGKPDGTVHPSAILCSPGYAAPEQLRGEPPAVGQDIFSLGALLYELLTGRRLRDNRMTDGLLWSGSPANGPIQPPCQVNRRISRDLDAICMVALADDPDSRYPSADALLKDLRCWQHKEPVAARQGGHIYHLGRFVVRNRLAVAAAALLAAVTIAGLGATMWQTQQARWQAERALAESERAEAARDFLTQLFEANDPDITHGRIPSARDLLDTGAHQIAHGFADSPELRAEMLVLLGRLNFKIGQFEHAGPLLEEALVVTTELVDTQQHAQALIAWGQLQVALGRPDTALPAFEQAGQALSAAGGSPGPVHAELTQARTAALVQLGRHDQAIEQAESALTQARATAGLSDDALFVYLIALAGTRLDAQQPEGAAQLAREAMALEVPANRMPTRRLQMHRTLQHALGRIGGDDRLAEYHAREALALAEAVFPPQHLQRIEALHHLAWPLMMSGRLEEARGVFAQALESLDVAFPDGRHTWVAQIHNGLGVAHMHEEAYLLAEHHLQLARELFFDLHGRNNQGYASATVNLGNVRRLQGDDRTAESLLQEALDIRRRVLGDEHPFVGRVKRYLGELRLAQGREHEALALADEAIDIYHRIRQIEARTEPRFLAPALGLRARALAAMGDLDAAEGAFREAVALADRAAGSAESERPQVLAAFAALLAERQAAEAVATRRQALLAYQEFYGPDHPVTQRIQASFGPGEEPATGHR